MSTYSSEIYEQIAAYVDSELSEKEAASLKEKINDDLELQFEYQVQSEVKGLLNKRFASQNAPAYLYDNILNEISKNNRNYVEPEKSTNNLLDFIKSLIQPKYAFAILTLIAAIFFLSTPFNSVDLNQLAEEQQGEYNIWVQANSNFKNIIEGNLTAQIASGDPNTIQNFFKDNGVAYSAAIPICKNWNLVGGVVSQDKGEKFAHHVYADDDGHILYVYQVTENYVGEKRTLELSDDMLNYISERKVYKHEFSDHTSFLVKSNDKIFAIVSNDIPQKIETDFISRIL